MLVYMPTDYMRECLFLLTSFHKPRSFILLRFGQTLKKFCYAGEIITIVFINFFFFFLNELHEASSVWQSVCL